jgi:hypothetical protein
MNAYRIRAPEQGRFCVREQTVPRCPALEDLLQADDLELSPEAHASVLDHLQHCAVCQARDRHALRTLRDVNRYLAGEFGEERQQARQHDFQVGLHKLRQALIHRSIGWPLRRWLPMAALTPVFMVALLLSWTGTVVVQADEFLQRAVAGERLRPRGSIQRVRVRLMPPNALAIPPRATASFTIVQELTDGIAFLGPGASFAGTNYAGASFMGARVTSAQAGVASETPMSVARLLAQHRFDWQQPLNVARFNAWRGTLGHKRDQVIALTDAPLLVLRTTTPDDRDLLEAELTVQRDNYHVVRAAFVFDGVGRLEIEELAEWVRHTPPATTMASDIHAAADPDRQTLVGVELATRLLLAQTGLDLPGTMRVSLTPARVRIDGAWPSAAQRRALNGRLLALAHVSVNLRVADAGDNESDGAESYARALESGSALSRFLEQAFGDERERDAFIPELTRLTGAVRQRLEVMQELAQRYPEREIRTFPADARATWQRLLDWHYQQLRADLNGLDSRVRVLSGSESRPFPASQVPVDWPRRTAAGLTQAIAFDRLVQELLAHQGLPVAVQDQTQDSLTYTFRALWDAVVSTRQPQGPRAES